MTGVRITHRPTRIAGGLSTLSGIVAVGLIAGEPVQQRALAATVSGLVALIAGLEMLDRDGGNWSRASPLVGGALILGGVAGAGLALNYALSEPGTVSARLEIVPGLCGLFGLVCGLAGFCDRWARRFLTAGTGLLFVTVVASGAVYGSEPIALLAATVATVFAWDLGEQAITLGEQVGRQSPTARAELLHGAGGLAVGIVAVGVARVFSLLDVTGLSVVVVLLLLGGAVALLLALAH